MSRYRVVITGSLDPGTVASFAGFTAHQVGDTTVLLGDAATPERLSGLLDELQALGLGLHSLQLLDEEAAEPPVPEPPVPEPPVAGRPVPHG